MSCHKKGLIFSIDALFSIIVLALFVSSLAFLANGPSGGSIDKLLLKKQAADLLSAMDKSGLLASADAWRTNSTLQLAIQPGTGYSLEIDYYDYYYSYSGSGGAFFPAGSPVYASGNIANATQVASSKRSFMVLHGSSAPQFGVATLTLWKGS